MIRIETLPLPDRQVLRCAAGTKHCSIKDVTYTYGASNTSRSQPTLGAAATLSTCFVWQTEGVCCNFRFVQWSSQISKPLSPEFVRLRLI